MDKATDKKQTAQDTFLNVMRKNKIHVTMFLVNGIKLQGLVTGFDTFVVILKKDNFVQLVYKHAISTIMPNEGVKFYDPEKPEDSEA